MYLASVLAVPVKVFLATLYVNYVDTVALSVADLWLFGQLAIT